MGDRFRLGELLAATGVIGLGLLLVLGHWFEPVLPKDTQIGALDTVSAAHLGWFALLICAAVLLAGLAYLARLVTARNPERIMLQVPILYAVGVFALLVLLVRVLAFPPDYDLQTGIAGGDIVVDTRVATGGWLGLLAAFLIPTGAWIAMADERTNSAAARKATAELLVATAPRPVPVPVGGPEADENVVADDQVPTDPSTGDNA